jgi:hypothetical protein
VELMHKAQPQLFQSSVRLAAIIAALVPVVSFADTLPPSTVSEEVYGADGKAIESSTSSGCVDGAGIIPALACASLGSDPSVMASTGDTVQSSGSAGVAYNFEVLGPPQVPVPIRISGAASASGFEFGGEITLGLFNFPLTDVTLLQFTSLGTAPPDGRFTIDTFATSDSVSQMFVGVGCTSFKGGGLCRSTIDPTIEIDPSFADASEFKLIGSTGLTSSVPEPSGLILLGTGLFAVARKLRQRTTPRQSGPISVAIPCLKIRTRR